jgi:uncharacterized protein YbbC (DUF1343 family)
MRSSAVMIGALLLALPCPAQQARVSPGIEVLRESGFELLQGKRVGLITNPTGVDGELRSTIDILNEADGVRLICLFGPEHGVRGEHEAGESVGSMREGRTGLPVYSLYGAHRAPSAEQLEGLDLLVYDIQDNGCRSYTYISTMGLAMEAAASAGIGFVVLDRPNPLGGLRVEGNIVEPEYVSFVSQYPIPYVYGLTPGELARLLNDEGMLAGGIRCNLSVVPMKGWTREMKFEDTGLPWVPPSPHLPESRTVPYYVATGVMGELMTINHGVGYTIPFQTFAASWIDGVSFCERATALGIAGVLFRPITYRAFYGAWKDETLHGVQLYITEPSSVNLLSIQFRLLELHHELYPEHDVFDEAGTGRLRMFDKVMGSDRVRKVFQEHYRYEVIREFFEQGARDFRELSRRYQLY